MSSDGMEDSTEQIRPSRVMVIEDSPEVRRAVVRSLARYGLKIIEADSGESGWNMIQEDPPDLVLTDVNMPGLDGFELLGRIRQNPATATLPVVLMTARDDRASIRRGMTMGADDYLTKPFTAQEIRETVQARLARHNSINAAHESQLETTRAELTQAAMENAETGLPNRRAFRDRIRKNSDEAVIVLTIEMDQFDRLQSAFSANTNLIDRLIKETSQRLKAAAPAASQLYHLSSNRFALLSPLVDAAEGVAEQMLDELRKPILDDDLELRVTASIGMAVHHNTGTSLETTAGHADTACSHARAGGGNHVVCFDAKLHDQAYNRLVLESSMHRALDREQFRLFYQPQISASTGQVIGMEALIRWQHPELGMVSPFHFIPIAEETGLIVPIGEWVVRTACEQAAMWKTALPGSRIAVNLSALQLKESNLVETVRDAIEQSGLAPERLKLEITESMMVDSGKGAADALQTLRNDGLGVSIDDFGTGYSNFVSLRALPVTEVKIDRSFVRHVPEDADHCSIVTAVIEMAHQLGLKVIAEGVEYETHIDFLQSVNCDVFQGYYYSKPVPGDDFLAWATEFDKKATRD